MSNCPCCSHQMLRHVCHGKVYWFCRNCYQEMPDLTALLLEIRYSKPLPQPQIPVSSPLYLTAR